MTADLRDVLRQQAETMRTLGDIETALRRARSRHRARAAMAISSVAVAAGLVIGGGVWIAGDPPSRPAVGPDPSHNATSGAPEPTNQPARLEISPKIRDWLPQTTRFDLLAPLGTAMGFECEGGGCDVLLMEPSGASQRMSDLSPDLMRVLAEVDSSDVSLSYNGRWLAVPAYGDVVLYPLAPIVGSPQPIAISAATPDRSWRVVEWGSASLGVLLAEYSNDTVTRYALVDLMTYEVRTMAAPSGVTMLPAGGFGIEPRLAEPVAIDVPPDRRKRLTEISTHVLVMTPGSGWPVGSVQPIEARPDDASGVLSSEETLAGMNGVPVIRTPPTSPGDDYAWPLATIFRPVGDDLQPVGVVALEREDNVIQPWRIDVPSSSDGDQWTMIGPVRDETLVVARRQNGRSELYAIDRNGQRTRLQNLDGDVSWVVPGVA